MSLVNDMLRDLDERKREGSTGHRTVAKRDGVSGRWIWVVMFIVFVAVVIFFVVRLWGEKINERVNFQAWLNNESLQTGGTHQPPSQELPALIAQRVDENSVSVPPELLAIPEKPTPALSKITVINWTSQSEQRGILTFWLDQVKPFMLYGRSDTTLDIAIDESRLAVGLPEINASLLKTIEVIPEEDKSRFKLVASAPVEFVPQLKQNPARLVIEVINSEAIALAPTIKKLDADKKVPAVNSMSEKTPSVDEPLKEASKDEQQAAQTTGQWKKSLNTLPTDSSIVRNARRLLSQQRTDEALKLLQNYVNKSPSSYQSRYLLVQLYLATERYKAASEILHTAPDNLSWGLLKARAFLQQGQAKQAIQLLDQYPDGQSRQDYLDLLASGYQQAGQHAAAVARYLSLLGLNPQEGRWWINLGVSLEHLGQTERALEAYRSALQIPELDQSLKRYAQLQSQRLMQSQ